MKSTAHGQHLVKLTRFGLVNAYLVREDDGLTLIDTAVSGSERGILAAAAALGEPIARIVITHGHDDHAGSLDALHAALPEAAVLIGTREARLMAGDVEPEPGEPPLGGGRIRVRETRPTTTLAPGERVGSLEVVAAPGHTPGQIALLDVRDRTLIAADAYATLGRVVTAGKPALPFPLIALAAWHRPTALVTARELVALSPARLATGHGPVVEAPGEAMERALKAAGA